MASYIGKFGQFGLISALAIAAAVVQTRASSTPSYNITDLGAPAGQESFAEAINQSGAVVGFTDTPDGSAPVAALWQSGQQPVTIPVTGFPGTLGMALNNNNQVIVQAGSTVPGQPTQTYIWSATTGAVSVGDSTLTLNQINDAGTAVGGIFLNNGATATPVTYSSANGIQTISIPGTAGENASAVAINNAGQILVEYYPTNRAILYSSDGTSTPVASVPQTGGLLLNGLSDTGIAVGSIETPAALMHAFVWDSGHGLVDLTPQSTVFYASASGVNDSGEVVGTESFSDTLTTVPFLYDDGQLYDFDALLGGAADGWGPISLVGINDAGQIAGMATAPDGQFHALLFSPDVGSAAAVPEPASGLLLLASIPFMLRRRRRVNR